MAKKSERPWQVKIVALVRGGLKNANDAHPELNNYNGLLSSVEKRLTNNIIAFVEKTLEERDSPTWTELGKGLA